MAKPADPSLPAPLSTQPAPDDGAEYPMVYPFVLPPAVGLTAHDARARDFLAREACAKFESKREQLVDAIQRSPNLETPPDPEKEALAQLGLVIGITISAEVALQMLFGGFDWVSRFAAFVLSLAVFGGLAGSTWNTHVARRAYFRPVMYGWMFVYLLVFTLSLGGVGLTSLWAVGASAGLVVSLIAAACATAFAYGAAVHVEGLAERMAFHLEHAGEREKREQALRDHDARGPSVR